MNDKSLIGESFKIQLTNAKGEIVDERTKYTRTKIEKDKEETPTTQDVK